MSIQFWSYLFALADWLNNSLYRALSGLSTSDGYLAAFSSTGGTQNFLLLDFITGAMYLGFPVMFTGFMALAGHKVGGAMSESLKGSAQSTGGKAGAGVAAIKTAATKGKG